MAYGTPLTCFLAWYMSVLPDSQMESTSTEAQYSLPRRCLSGRYLHPCACTYLRSTYSSLDTINRRPRSLPRTAIAIIPSVIYL